MIYSTRMECILLFLLHIVRGAVGSPTGPADIATSASKPDYFQTTPGPFAGKLVMFRGFLYHFPGTI